jgi:hypothetical protein
MRKCEGASCRSAESEGAGRDVRRCGAGRYTSGQMLEAALENCHFMPLLPRLGVIPTCLKPNGKPFPATQIGHETLALRLLRYPVARSGTVTAMSGTPAVHYLERRSPFPQGDLLETRVGLPLWGPSPTPPTRLAAAGLRRDRFWICFREGDFEPPGRPPHLEIGRYRGLLARRHGDLVRQLAVAVKG